MTRFLLSFGAWATGLSGGDRHLLETAARWQEHVDVEVIAPDNARATIYEHLGEVEYTARGWSPDLVTSRGPALAFEYVRRAVLAELKPARADVVVAASHFSPDAAAVHAAARYGAYGVAFVYHLVAGRSDRGLRTLWSKSDEIVGLNLLRGSAQTVFTSNAETFRQLEQRGFTPLRTNVGLDLASFRTERSAETPPVVLFVARLAAKKGLRDLIHAWPIVLERAPSARLVVAGSGPEREPAERLAREFGVASSIEWKGFVDEATKRDLLARARVFVAPSYEEGWGIAVAEAMASALPVVAYRLPALDEVFGDAYLAAQEGSVEQLANGVAHLLGDDAEAAQMAERGLASVARYDIRAVAERELEAILSRRRAA